MIGGNGNGWSIDPYTSSVDFVSGGYPATNISGGMPDPTSTTGAKMTGRSGHGYARITWVSP
jgi:hypothetical protein